MGYLKDLGLKMGPRMKFAEALKGFKEPENQDKIHELQIKDQQVSA